MHEPHHRQSRHSGTTDDEDEHDEFDTDMLAHQYSTASYQMKRKESASFLLSQRKLSEISEEENAEIKTPRPSTSSSEKRRFESSFPANLLTIMYISHIIANVYKDYIKCKRNKK